MAKTSENTPGANSQDTAVAMSERLGNQATTLSAEWQQLGHLDFGTWLMQIGENLGMSWSEWQLLLVKSGISMEKTILLQLQKLQALQVEQQTAIKLRQDFGVPQAPLPMILEVFTQLAGFEADAREDLQLQATQVEQWWGQLRRQVQEALALTLAMRLEELEQEEQAYIASLEHAQAEAEGRNTLQATVQFVQEEVRSNLASISRQKSEILSSLSNLGFGVLERVQRVFEMTVFSASHQSLGLSPVS